MNLKQKALTLLARKAYFKKEIMQKLIKQNFEKKEIQALLQEFEKKGWIDDEALARSFIEKQLNKGYGSKIILSKLKEKAGEAVANSLIIKENQEAILKIIQKYQRQKRYQNKQKLISALLRRGYSLDSILMNI